MKFIVLAYNERPHKNGEIQGILYCGTNRAEAKKAQDENEFPWSELITKSGTGSCKRGKVERKKFADGMAKEAAKAAKTKAAAAKKQAAKNEADAKAKAKAAEDAEKARVKAIEAEEKEAAKAAKAAAK